jgi:hypothetical protein
MEPPLKGKEQKQTLADEQKLSPRNADENAKQKLREAARR